MATPLLFRVSGSIDWRVGRLANMSGTGALVDVSELPPAHCGDIDFIVPVSSSVGTFGPLVCGVGRVVRLTTGQQGASDCMALAIDHCEILRVPVWAADSVDGLFEPEWDLAQRT